MNEINPGMYLEQFSAKMLRRTSGSRAWYLRAFLRGKRSEETDSSMPMWANALPITLRGSSAISSIVKTASESSGKYFSQRRS